MLAEKLTYYKNEVLENPECLYKFYSKDANSLNSILENYIFLIHVILMILLII